MTADKIRHLTLSHVVLPLENPVSDAKVLTGRQKPLTETVLLFVEVETEQGHTGMGFSYSKRAGGPAQFTHLREVAEVAIGQDPSDIARIYESLMWAGASVGRSGVATQAVAALDVALYDLKARRAGLPLAKLLGAHRDSCRVYNTSGGFLQASVEEIKEKAIDEVYQMNVVHDRETKRARDRRAQRGQGRGRGRGPMGYGGPMMGGFGRGMPMGGPMMGGPGFPMPGMPMLPKGGRPHKYNDLDAPQEGRTVLDYGDL